MFDQIKANGLCIVTATALSILAVTAAAAQTKAKNPRAVAQAAKSSVTDPQERSFLDPGPISLSERNGPNYVSGGMGAPRSNSDRFGSDVLPPFVGR